MLIEKLHVDEVDIDLDDVRALVDDQYPVASGLPLVEVVPPGTSNVMVRLGDGLVVRLPRNASAVESLEKEARFPQLLAPRLPVPISTPLFVGTPGAGYPYSWSISRWLDGSTPSADSGASVDLALDLAGFVTALHAVETTDAPLERLRSYRGEPIALVDESVRSAIGTCDGLLDRGRLTAAWDAVRNVTDDDQPPAWIHTDLQPGNILVSGGRLRAVVDWGGLAIGDSAVDLIVAWNLLDPAARSAFRDAVAVPDTTWRRGRAWALAIGIIAYPYYVRSNPQLAAISKYQIEQVIAELSL